MTLTQWISAFGGAITVGLLIMLIFFLRWDDGAGAHLQEVTQTIEALEKEWSARGNPVEVSYDDAFVRGFPFGTRVHLIRPTIHIKLKEGTLGLMGSYLTLSLEGDEGDESYRASVLSDAMMTFLLPGKKEPEYYQLHLSQVPELRLKANAKLGVGINQWQVTLPQSFIINAQKGSKSGQHSFSAPAPIVTRWEAVPSDISYPLIWLMRFADEVATQEAPAPTAPR